MSGWICRLIWGNRNLLQQFDCSASPVWRCLKFILAVEFVLHSVAASCCNAIHLDGSACCVALAGVDAGLDFAVCGVSGTV